MDDNEEDVGRVSDGWQYRNAMGMDSLKMSLYTGLRDERRVWRKGCSADRLNLSYIDPVKGEGCRVVKMVKSVEEEVGDERWKVKKEREEEEDEQKAISSNCHRERRKIMLIIVLDYIFLYFFLINYEVLLLHFFPFSIFLNGLFRGRR